MAPRGDPLSEIIDLVSKLEGGKLRRKPKVSPIRWPRPYPDDHAKAGKPRPCLENTQAMLEHYGIKVAFNLMTHREEVDAPIEVAAERKANAGKAHIRELARMHGLSAGKALEDHLELIIAKTFYHPVANWICSKPWDEVDRIEALFASLTIEPEFLAANAAHARRILKAWVIIGAQAAMLPADVREGVAAQGVLVLQGPQGAGKTRWIMSLVPHGNGWAQESVMIDPSSRDSKEAATKSWLSELGEIDATFRKADIAALKGFLTQRIDTYRKAYDRAPEDIARRTFFAASVNEYGFLADETGSRRFWTLPVIATNPLHGIDLQQLWAQAAYLAQAEPDAAWLTGSETETLKAANAAFDAIDPIWESAARTLLVDDRAAHEANWMSLDDAKANIDKQRVWSVADGRHLARVLKNRMAAPTRISRGYTQYALQRRPRDPEAPEEAP